MKRDTLILIISASLSLLICAAGCQEESVSKEIPETAGQSQQAQGDIVIETQEEQATESNSVKPDPNIQGPRIEFETTTQDIGTISTSSSQTCEFEFKNTGNEQLKITNLRSTCGCTIAELKKREYEPGEEGAIKITYRSSIMPEKVSKHLYVVTNDPANKTVQLTIKGAVVKKVEATPDNIKLSLKKENGGFPEITIKSLDDKSFAIQQVKSTADCVAADFDPSKTATSFTVTPQVDMEKLEQILSGDIAFILTHPNCKNVTVHFEAQPIFKTTSPTVLILNAEPGVTVTREPIWIINNYGEDFEIESVICEKGAVENLSVSNGGIGRRGLKLQITPPEKDAKSNVFIDNVTVKTSLGNEVKIICRLYYKRT